MSAGRLGGRGEIVRNATFSFGTLVAKIAAGVGLLVALAHTLPRDGFGVFTYAFSAASILGYFVDYGFGTKLLKDLSEKPGATSRTISIALRAKTLLAVLVFMFLLAVWFWPSLTVSERRCVVLLGLAQVLASMATTLLNPYKCTNRFDVETAYVGLDSFVTIVACIWAAVYTRSPESIAAAFLVAKCVFCLLVWIRYRRDYALELITAEEVWREVGVGMPYALHLFVGNVYLNVDTVILKEFVSISDVGLYQAGMRLVIGAGMALTVVNSVLTPRLTMLRQTNDAQFHTEARRAGMYLLVAGALALLVLTVGGRRTVALLYGPKYEDLVTLLAIFGVVIFLRYVGAVYGVLLTISGRQTVRAFGVAITLVYLIALDLAIIPRYGTFGAAWVLLSAHVFLTALYAFFVRSEYGHFFFRSVTTPTSSAAFGAPRP